ncbi:hypothetical protein C2G38_2287978 [Gigaspora rosea]|uniref:Uncharacterized protein n=1 Tax=Gigaspora rosea TaxID=44941 RepID=A0A397TZN6_9GLOM|nr:hypothetical protein C2G38_2287978 [Gigaspora rosea]
MARTRNVMKKKDAPLRSAEANDSVEDHERQATNVEDAVNKRKKVSNRTNVKKRREYKEPIDESPLRSVETNNLAEDHELQVEVTANKGNKSSNRTNTKKRLEIEQTLINSDDEIIQPSRTPFALIREDLPSKNIVQQREQTAKASSSSSLIRSSLSYNKRPFASKATPSFLDRSDSPESIYSKRSPLSNIASSPLINHSFDNTNNQRPLTSNKINNSSTSLIDPFKNDLELCLYLVQHLNLIKLTMSMIEAGGQGSTVIQEKANKFDVLLEKMGLWLLSGLQCNASLRKVLRNLVPEFIRKYKLTKTRQPEMQQISEYITESNWEPFLKRHMDILDLEKTFRK